jgi:hypothetical protein
MKSNETADELFNKYYNGIKNISVKEAKKLAILEVNKKLSNELVWRDFEFLQEVKRKINYK